MSAFRRMNIGGAVGIAVLVASLSANAATLIDTRSDNDPFNDGLQVGNVLTPSLAKCETEAEGASSTNKIACSKWDEGSSAGTYTFGGGTTSAFTVTYIAENVFEWAFDATKVVGELLYPSYIAVKASNSHEVWKLDPAETSGTITSSITKNGNIAAISHVSFYDTGTPPPPVPLPAAGWLMLAGFGGLAALRRRRKAA